jgi:transcriptional regulator with AAA-type ATPase domain
MGTNIFEKELPEHQPILNKLYKFMANLGRFSVLVIGERGTGKSRAIKLIQEELKKEKVPYCDNFTEASCASFGESTAISELFGYEAFSFTGSDSKPKDGIFFKANKGVLFLDEVDHLNDQVKAQLLTALQTESSGKNKGKYLIRKLGSSKSIPVTVRLVFGSNKKISDLIEKTLLPDFYDRIAQLVVELPSLNELSGKSKRMAFEKVWENMAFNQTKEFPKFRTITQPLLSDFYRWIEEQNFSGNFRDLETIAILWMVYWEIFEKNEREIFINVKKDFEKYHANVDVSSKIMDVGIDNTYKHHEALLKKKYALLAAETEVYRNANNNDKIDFAGMTKKQLQSFLKLI